MNGFWARHRVFVTGGTGLIGSWLVRELLDQGAEVTCLVRDADPQSLLVRSGAIQCVAVVSGDLEQRGTLQRAMSKHESETVFHLGAQTIVGTAHRLPVPTFEANIRGTYHVLEACRCHAGVVRRVVIASSDKAYGEQPELPYTEAMPLQGRHPYEVSKTCADLIAQAYYHTYRLPVAIARCGNVYGGGDLHWSRVVPGTIRSLLKGERPVIRSDGTYRREYLYVRDVAQAYLRLAECLDHPGVAGEAFNFSDPRRQPLTVLELVDRIRCAMGCAHLEPEIQDIATGEIRHQHLSSRKAQERLGWKPMFDLDAGLQETIAWYRAFFAQAPQLLDRERTRGRACQGAS